MLKLNVVMCLVNISQRGTNHLIVSQLSKKVHENNYTISDIFVAFISNTKGEMLLYEI